MAPPRRILRQQLEILVDYLENNKDICKGLLPGSPVSHQKTRQKWASVSKQLNAVQSGALKSPDGWKRYWFEWRHKCRKKAANARRFQSNSDSASVSKRFVPMNDLELRVLDLCGKGGEIETQIEQTSNQIDDFFCNDSDSEPLENIKARVTPTMNIKGSAVNVPLLTEEHNLRTVSPPPKWALEFEERRIAAEERMAHALESIASIMRAQEERRGLLEERIADALSAIAGTVQDLNSGVQETLTHLQQKHPLQGNGPGLKNEVFL